MLLSKSMIEKFTKKIQSVPSQQNSHNNQESSHSDQNSQQFFPNSSGSSRSNKNSNNFNSQQPNDHKQNKQKHVVRNQNTLHQRNNQSGLYITSKDSQEESSNNNQQKKDMCENLFAANIAPKIQRPFPNTSRKTVAQPNLQEKIKSLMKPPPPRYVELPDPPKANFQPDGKNVPQNFKKQFSQKLLVMVEGLDQQGANQMIKRAAKKIQVYAYQIKLWMVAYQIINKVDIFESECKTQGFYVKNQRKLDIVQKQIIQYLSKNTNSKKYKIMKIIGHVFKILNINQSKAREWLKNIIKGNRDKLIGFNFKNYGVHEFNGNDQDDNSEEINSNQIQSSQKKFLQRNNDKQQSDSFNQVYKRLPKENTSEDQFIPNSALNGNIINFQQNAPKNKKSIKRRKIRQKQQECNNSRRKSKKYKNYEDNQQVIAFPEFFKKSVATKLDQLLSKNIEELIRQKSQQMCMQKQTLKAIHRLYGKVTIQNTQIFVQSSDKQSQKLIVKSQKRASRSKNKKQIDNTPKIQDKKNKNQSKILEKTDTVPKNMNFQGFDQIVKNISSKEATICDKALSTERQLLKLQKHLSLFLKNNPNYHIKDLQNASDSFMQTNKFNIKLKNQVRSRWFAYFIKKYNVRIPRILHSSKDKKKQI